MKLQLHSSLTDIVRKPRTHRIPENLFLQIMIYFCVFILMQLAETLMLVPFLYQSFMDWGTDAMQKMQSGETFTYERIMTELTNIMMHADNVIVMLFCTGAGTVAVLLYCRIVEGRRLRTLGFLKQHALVQYLLGLAAGAVTFSLIVGIAWLCGGLTFNGYRGQFTVNLLLVFIGFLIQGMSEEVLCRGFMMTSTLRGHHLWWAVGINAVFFGLFHAANNGFTLFALLNLILFGVTASLYVLRTGNLWGACAFHSIWNFAQGNFYGLPVSGMDAGDTVFSMSLNGSSIFNGGAFGLEASIGTTIVLAVWIAALLLVPSSVRKQEEAQAA